ncbi:hypothetical protein PR202_gb21772 [Eleusine coracana subsp. coracana]|uniref:DUF1997 family protein n=1 Tax=Eleusine coracana subsp. coracana TaxID=191504 RepID=A0AAV5FEI1_ELECO|nr:hypothetical protein QOZ80_7BG0609830 [Eleusine coracana subsp. coracana]GJN33201.1 hypothetical protein PR202_gb21772 [Eleusine coracana subsp. coracana]
MAANTAQSHLPWPLAARARRGTTSRPTAIGVRVRDARSPRAWTGRPPPRRAVATKAGAAEVRPSSSPDAVTYTASISTDVPLYEPPGVSFDEYLQDRARVFRAMFPDETRSQRLSDGEWRIQMLPLQFLLLTVRPVVVMQLRRRRAGGIDLRITEWELRGLDSGYAPASFDLGVRGSLYADRGRRGASRMKGHLEIAITCVLPPALRIVPETVLRGVAESVLSRLAEKMKRDVDVGLVADFQRFRREKAPAASGALAQAVDVAAADRDAA